MRKRKQVKKKLGQQTCQFQWGRRGKRSEAFWPSFVMKKWFNIKPKVNDFSEDEVDTETETTSFIVLQRILIKNDSGLGQEDRKQTSTNYQFGPFALAFVSKSKTFENTKAKQVHDWESLATEHSPQQECVDAMLLGLPENAFVSM
ncbi:unnamed protein product [Vicia faba]|uniref:Uncharacterized protein n=1 Tax=Vicia faba TaxID=3906 RepID=A0AAV0YZB0_VICFA|nr:unnamed protein product [Vicia faba]